MKFITILTLTIIAGCTFLNDSAVAQVADAAQICGTPAVAQSSCARDSVTTVAAVVAASNNPASAFQTATTSLSAKGPVGQSFATQLQNFFSQPGRSSSNPFKGARNANSTSTGNSQEFAAACVALVANLCQPASPKRCCDNGTCGIGEGCDGRECKSQNDCPQPVARCAQDDGGWRCKVTARERGFTCTDENCNPDHPPRCVAYRIDERDERRAGACTLNYDKAEVGSNISERECNDDASCQAYPVCDIRTKKCVAEFSIPKSAEGGRCSSIGTDRDCERKRCDRRERRCHENGDGELCVYDENCRAPTYCDESGRGKCLPRDEDEPKGKLCYSDSNCDGNPLKSYCNVDGQCSGNDNSNSLECVPGYDGVCQLEICQEGSCRLPKSYPLEGKGVTSCENDRECETRTVCSNGACLFSDAWTDVNACRDNFDCLDDNRPRSCSARGYCGLAGEHYVNTCEFHAECHGRGYPDYCAKLSEIEQKKDPRCMVDFTRLTPLEAGSTTTMARLSTDAVQQQREESNQHAKVAQAIKPAEVVKRLRGTKPSHVWGKANAKVTLAIFHDLACGQCKRVHRESFGELAQSFINTGKLKVEFYEFPLIMGKDVARHYGALCAGRQGKYVQFVEKVYENFKEYDVRDQARYAKTVEGLDLAQWDRCMSKTDSPASIVKAHKEVGSSVGVDGTPTLFLNGEGVSNFREVLIPSVAKLAQ